LTGSKKQTRREFAASTPLHSHPSIGASGAKALWRGPRRLREGDALDSAAIGSNRAEAAMLTTPTTYCGLDRIVAVIARSPIVVSDVCSAEASTRLAALPDHFDKVDLAILDWLAAEGRRIRRSVARI